MHSAGLATIVGPNVMPFHIGGLAFSTLKVLPVESILVMSAVMHSGRYSSTLSENLPEQGRQCDMHEPQTVTDRRRLHSMICACHPRRQLTVRYVV